MSDVGGEERLGRMVRRAAEQISPPPVETVEARGRSLLRRRRMLGASGIAAVAVVVVISAAVLTRGDTDPPSDLAVEPPAVLEDDAVDPPADPELLGGDSEPQMRVSSEVVVPGETVGLTFPDPETQRGLAFTLERWTGSEWVHEFWLISDWSRPDETTPHWARVGEPVGEPFAVPDIGIGGPGPDVVAIPDVAPPGRYRICTDQPNPLCAELSVEELEIDEL